MLRPRGQISLPWPQPRSIYGLDLGLVASGLLGLVETCLVASNMTLINIYNLVIDVHLLEKLVFLKCNDC